MPTTYTVRTSGPKRDVRMNGGYLSGLIKFVLYYDRKPLMSMSRSKKRTHNLYTNICKSNRGEMHKLLHYQDTDSEQTTNRVPVTSIYDSPDHSMRHY